jgi:integrase
MGLAGDKTRTAIALTARYVATVKAEEQAYRVPDARCKGLALRVAPNGGRTWATHYRVKGGADKRVSLGKIEDLSLEVARERTNQLTSAARRGIDLIVEEASNVAQTAQRKAAEAQELTIEDLIAAYVRKRVSGRLRSAARVESRLRRALAPIAATKATDVKRRDLRPLLEAVSDSGRSSEAEKRRQTIGAMFAWALSQDLVEANPAAGLTSFGRRSARTRTLSADEIARLWRWIEAGGMPASAGGVIQLQLLLGARASEVGGMTRSEIERRGARLIWTLPAARSKNGRARVTPLVGAARASVERRLEAGEGELLFPSERGVRLTSELIGGLLSIRRGSLPVEKFTTHDLRRTTATMMLRDLCLPLELIAAVVGHVGAGDSNVRTSVAHYIHDPLLDRKEQALLLWDRRVTEITTALPTATPIDRRSLSVERLQATDEKASTARRP